MLRAAHFKVRAEKFLAFKIPALLKQIDRNFGLRMFLVFFQNTSSFSAPKAPQAGSGTAPADAGTGAHRILSFILLIFPVFFKGILYHLGNPSPKKSGHFIYFTQNL